MSKRNDILDTLKTQIETKIDPARNYNVGLADVKRGIYTHEEIIAKPALCIYCIRDRTDGDYQKIDKRIMELYVYGYSNNLDEIHNMADDFMYFIINDYNDDNVSYITIGDINMYEGGANAPTYMFDITIDLHYNFATDTLGG